MIVIPFYLPGNLLVCIFVYVFSVEGEDEDEDDDDDSDNANIWVLLLHLLLQCFVQSFSSFSESSISSKALVILLLLLLPSFPRLNFPAADSEATPQLPFLPQIRRRRRWRLKATRSSCLPEAVLTLSSPLTS